MIRIAVVLTTVAILARLVTFGNPILHIDEQFYLAVARKMLDGNMLYVDVWDRKPAGLFLLYMLAFLFGGDGTLAYQLMALACVVGTALLLVELARRTGWERGSLAAGILYILWLNFAEGQGGQAPVFYNLPMAAAALLTLKGVEAEDARVRLCYGAAVMGLVGIAIQLKYSVLFEGIYFGLLFLHAEWRTSRRFTRLVGLAAPLITIALLPTLLVALWFARHGEFDPFFYANFVSIFQRGAEPGRVMQRIEILCLILSPLLFAALIPLWRDRGGERPGPAFFVRGWLFAAVAGLVLFGGWFDHYSLPVLVPAACCCAALFADRRIGRGAMIGMLGFAAIGGQVVLYGKRTGRGTPEQIAEVERAVGEGPGCLFLYQGDPVLYSMSRRCIVTRYIFPGHLNHMREEDAIGTDALAELRRVLSAHPAVVVMKKPDRSERPLAREVVLAAMRRDYQLAAFIPMGRNYAEIYRLKTP